MRNLCLLGLLAGCTNSHLVGGTEATGYLGGDSCSQHADQSSCTGANGCAWIVAPCPPGATCPAGICYQPDPCLKIADAASCNANSACAWSAAATLCPAGATCGNGGYCHPKDPSGGGCGCVTPVACPQGAACPPPECDCSGGGGGGSCTCACPDCAPGQACPPCQCNCSDGGGSGCVDQGTCVCNCPDCAPDTDCAPCACGCGGSGPVPAPSGASSTTTTTSGSSTSPGQPDPNGNTDPCNAFTDSASCAGDSADHCQWFGLGVACMIGQPCVSGVCQSSTPPPATGCGCACPSCAPGESCPPCNCNCTDPSGGCAPTGPSPSSPPTSGVCPAIGCTSPSCPNGTKLDANGCPTCQCA